ncbi:hypothetical protein Tco_0421398 [Tanacetum coccineum]
MSADSAITYTSVHSEARSWSIPSEDPYEEAAQQLLEQAPRSPEDPTISLLYTTTAPLLWRRADIPELIRRRKRLLLTTPRPGCEIGESSAAAAARQPGPTMAHRVDHSHVDTMETRFRDIERRMMTALEMVNMRVSYQVDVRSRESSEFHSRHHDAQKDRAAVRAEIEVLRRERLAYKQESMETRQALARLEAGARLTHWRTLVAVPRLWFLIVSICMIEENCTKVEPQGQPVVPTSYTASTNHNCSEAQLQALMTRSCAAMAEARSKVGLGMATIAMVLGPKASPNCSAKLLL